MVKYLVEIVSHAKGREHAEAVEVELPDMEKYKGEGQRAIMFLQWTHSALRALGYRDYTIEKIFVLVMDCASVMNVKEKA